MGLAWLLCKLWEGLKYTSKFPRDFIYVIHRLTEKENLVSFDLGDIILDTVDNQLKKFKESQHIHATS